MFVWLLSLFLPSLHRVDEAVYGFNDVDIEHLSGTLAVTFGIRFYIYHNPIIGSWCSSVPASMSQDSKDETSAADTAHATYIIIENVYGTQIQGAGDYLLLVTALTHEIQSIRKKLGNSGLNFKEVKRKRSRLAQQKF